MKKQYEITLRYSIYLAFIFFLIFYSFLVGVNSVMVPLLIVIYFYIKKSQIKTTLKIRMHQLGFLFCIGFSLIFFLRFHTNLSAYYLPVPALAMVTMLLFPNMQYSLLMALTLSFLSAYLFQNDLNLAAILFIGSLIGIFFVDNIRKRLRIIQAGLFVSLGMTLSIILLSFRPEVGFDSLYSPHLVPALVNGILWSFFVAGILPLFEYLFKAVTNISLLEYSDFNHPLLKRLVLEAPGTYHHSLMVGNLAEVAAEAIGANSLLARVGSYYHDIGKLHKPEYFSENLDKSISHHEQLKASMSKLVIINHIKEGVELATKYKLNRVLIDFIQQHHGTSLVFYFYRKALEGKIADSEEVKEEVFRYPGPKPQTKEIAIVLLADSVEAACRSLESPDAQRIEEVVNTVVNNKFIDGQLDECELTLRDLYKIAATFKRILTAIYHSRIEYPSEKDEDNNKESTERNKNRYHTNRSSSN